MNSSPDFVTVLESENPGLIAVAKSVLDSAGIPYIIANEVLHTLFGAGSVKIRVANEFEKEACALLTQLNDDFSEDHS
ncbi:DUF2007 domain-containing protein [Thermodesulfobacteriota bacterium]